MILAGSATATKRKLQFRLHLELDYQVLAHAGSQEVPQVRQGTHFHLALRILVLRTHVRQERDVGELQEARVDLGLIGKYIQTRSKKLYSYGLVLLHKQTQNDLHVRLLEP